MRSKFTIAIACFLSGCVCWLLVARGSSNGSTVIDGVDRSIAKPSLTPKEVVEKQVASMRAGLTDPEQLVACFSLASPGNRMLTGPFERFCEMALQQPYDKIARSEEVLVAEPVQLQEYASVLVTASSSVGELSAFRFFLIKQSEKPYQDCWMTEAVVPMEIGAEDTPAVLGPAEVPSFAGARID